MRRAITISERGLAVTTAEALYGQALLLSRRPLKASESALLNRAFIGLLTHAMHDPGTDADGSGPRKDI